MKITSISIDNYSSTISCRITAWEEDTQISIELTEDEARELYAMAESTVLRRKEAIAKTVLAFQPLALSAPEAEWTEV